MDERAERLGRNEILYRDVNEEVLAADARLGGRGERIVAFFCECADPSCTQQIELSLAEYESVRADPTYFAIVPGHEVPDIEVVVTGFDDRAEVVCKREGGPAELARAHDPR